MEKKANPIAILVLGICSIVFAGPVGLILSIIAMVMSKKADLTDNKAKIGKILAIIGLILSIISIIAGIAIIPTIIIPIIMALMEM